MKVCFIGHKKIQNANELIPLLKTTIIELINKGATTFLFGSKSQFNDLSWEVVTWLKVEYPFIKRVYVRSAFQYINELYKNHLLEYYEETYFPPKLENAGKYSYVERNYELIDNSTFCVFYYDENYVNSLKEKSIRNSGTKIAYDYAKKRNKEIINLCK